MPKDYQPSNAELDILRVLWDGQPLSVRQVHDILCQEKEIGYTTTLKQMQRMLEKGVLKRAEAGHAHLYSTAIEETQLRRSLLNRLLDKAFGGASADLMMQVLGQSNPTPEELERLEQMIREKKKEQS